APRRRQRRAGTTARPGGHAGSARRSERGRRHHASSFRADALHHARTVAVARERPWSRDQRERHRGPGPLGRRRRRLLSDATPGPLRYAGGPAPWRRPLGRLVAADRRCRRHGCVDPASVPAPAGTRRRRDLARSQLASRVRGDAGVTGGRPTPARRARSGWAGVLVVLVAATPGHAGRSFIPIPEIILDPNEGTTLGVLPVVLFTNEKDEIRYMLAPDFSYN